MAPANLPESSRGNGQSAIDDPMSPYFLHHSDNPGLTLVSQSLIGDNYASWSRAMHIALSVKNKLGFVDGTVARPSASDATLLSFWIRNNNIVISWILNFVSKDISASILFSESAASIWDDLKERFQQSDGPRIFQLRRDLVNLRQGQSSVSVYFTKLKALWEELNNFCPMCSCGKCSCEGVKKLDDHIHMEYVMSFLMGLNDSFAQIRSQVLLLDSLPSINRVFSLIVQEERNRVIGAQVTNPISTGDMAFALKNEQPHKIVHGQGYSRFPKERPFCTKCNIHGHTVDTCCKIHGYPPGFKIRGKNTARYSTTTANQITGTYTSTAHVNTSDDSSQSLLQGFNKEQLQQLRVVFDQHITSHDNHNTFVHALESVHITGTCFSTSAPNSLCSPSCWVIDSGASRHICSYESLFNSLHPVTGSTVTFPNHTTIEVKFCGSIKLGESLILEDVMFIPSFKFNLLSVSSLIATTKSMISFYRDSFIIQEVKTRKTIGKGRKIEGLYILNTSSASPNTFINQISIETWHSRLGHPSDTVMHTLRDQLHCSSVTLDNGKFCSICPLAKQRRLAFVSHNNMSDSPFDLVHCDIWGPYNVATQNNQRYFLTMVDDCTRFTWVFLLQHKSDACGLVSRFYSMVKTQFLKKIKSFRTDNAKELAFKDLCVDKGIIHQLSCVQTPQQNSVVERKHQHLLNVARALFFQSHVAAEFWGECILTATYLINRVPSPTTHHKSPYELIYQRPFEFSSLRTFGCLAFASTLAANRDKLSPRARTCVFLGYPASIKGYKLLDINTKEIFISRDVIFHETTFPFLSITPNLSVDSFPSVVLPLILETSSHDTLIPTSNTAPNSLDTNVTSSLSVQAPNPLAPVSHRTSSRSIQPPSYLRDYHCNLLHSDISLTSKSQYRLNSYISYASLSNSYRNLTLNVSSQFEPQFYHQAKNLPQWQTAMKDELDAMEANHTCSIIPLPPGKQAIGCRWVYKIKYASNGSIDRHKARLVAKGYTQQEGVDFFETFSPVAKLATVKVLLALAASQQ